MCLKDLLGLVELKNLSLLAIVNAVGKDEFNPVKPYPGVFRGLGTILVILGIICIKTLHLDVYFHRGL